MKNILVAVLSSTLFIASAYAKVEIKDKHKQTVTVENGGIANLAIGAQAKATQNVSSNTGNVKIGSGGEQKTSIKNGGIVNLAIGPSTAKQNIASNDGK